MKYELKAMGLGEVIDNAIRVLLDNLALIVAINLVLQMPLQVFATMLDPASISRASILPVLFTLLGLLMISPITYAASLKAIGDRYLGRPTSVLQAYRHSLAAFQPLFATLLLASLFTLLGYLALIIPGIYLTVRYAFAAQVAVLEKLGGPSALKRSGALMRDNYGRIIMLMMVTGIVSQTPLLFLQYLDYFGLPPLGRGIVIGVVGTVGGAFGSCVMTVAYFEVRCRKEGFDLQVLAESLGDPAASPA